VTGTTAAEAAHWSVSAFFQDEARHVDEDEQKLEGK